MNSVDASAVKKVTVGPPTHRPLRCSSLIKHGENLKLRISFLFQDFPIEHIEMSSFFGGISHGRGEMSEAWRDRSACICTRARISESRSVSQRKTESFSLRWTSPKWQWFVYGYFYGVIIPWMEWLPDLYLVFRATTVVRVATNTV